jgi:predicted ester cyclase
MITQRMFSGFARRVADPSVPSRATASGGEESPMLVENKAIVRRLYEEVWNKRRLEVADELISPSHALNDPIVSSSQTGPELYKQRVVEFTTSFPDLRFTIEDMITEGKGCRLLDYFRNSPCHGQQDIRGGNHDSPQHKWDDSRFTRQIGRSGLAATAR